MKRLLLSFVVFIMLCINYSFSNKVENVSFQQKSPIEIMLKNFYSEYITECRKNTPENNIDLVLKKYVTNKLLKKIERLDLDYDPFINAQDCDENFFKNFKIKKDLKQTNTFIISYIVTYTKKTISITLIVVELKGKYKIDDIKGI